MLSVKQLIGSIIASYLGPFKSNKFVVDDEDVYMVKCPVSLLQKMNHKDHLSHLIEETLLAHHEQYGCSSISLLAMWYIWNEEFQIILEDCETVDIITHSQNILEEVISQLTEITIQCKETFFKRKSEQNLPESSHKYKNSFDINSQSVVYPMKKSVILNMSSSTVPIGIRYSSRHFSPSQSQLSEDEPKLLKDNTIQNILNIETLEQSMLSVVEKLSHGDFDCMNLICDIWIKQAKSSDCLEFNINGIIICPVTMHCSYSTVVDGLIIKSNQSHLHTQDLNIENCRALIIKGSITYEYVHLGYTENISVTVKKSAEQLQISTRELWIRKCCDLLSELEVNCLLVTGDVETDLESFCSANSILLLPGISWTHLQDLCISVNEFPCTYLLDCDQENIISNLIVKKWNFDYNESLSDNLYVHIDFMNIKGKNKLYTVMLCHPNQFLLNSQEHQFWHLASRLHSATKNNILLPGGGKTEKWCFDLLQKSPSENEIKDRIRVVISKGFLSYSQMISNKNIREEICNALDEMQSKVQAWRSAMALVLTVMQCDFLILNGCENSSLKKIALEKDLLGFL